MNYPALSLAPDQDLEPGSITWQSPSNIAIIKYWGKHGNQLPLNPSLSLTLEHAFTEMRMNYALREDDSSDPIALSLYFHGIENAHFAERIKKYLTGLLPIYPFLKQIQIDIDTANSFPHSAGIASSASAMSALALCLCSLEDMLFGTLGDQTEFIKKAGSLARLGSGSACRSVHGGAALWGYSTHIEGSTDDYAISLEEMMHPVFKTYRDDILIVSSGTKKISSSEGHALMTNHPYARVRYAQAHDRTREILDMLQEGDVHSFGQVAEEEALTLHALMMMSNPPYMLMEADTIAMIHKIQEFRKETQVPLYFTLDAGPNVHLLYPFDVMDEVQPFVDSELIPMCEEGLHIRDNVGEGPEEM